MDQRQEMIEATLCEMASVVAAAVHQGWIPIQEILDMLDSDAMESDRVQPSGSNIVQCNFSDEKRDWALWTAQRYVDPQMAGAPMVADLACWLLALGIVCCTYGHSCQQHGHAPSKEMSTQLMPALLTVIATAGQHCVLLQVGQRPCWSSKMMASSAGHLRLQGLSLTPQTTTGPMPGWMM